MALNQRNTRFFWVMLILLGLALYLGIMFVSTVDNCGQGPKEWQWAPPGWVCTRPGF